MNIYELSSNDNTKINFNPSNEVEEILQNVQTIISTVKYTVPLDRAFGINPEIVDMPIHLAQAKISEEIFTAIKKYEPRAQIEDISFEGTQAGALITKVKVSI